MSKPERSYDPVRLIEAVRGRPGLYSAEPPLDRDEKLQLWRELAAALYDAWPTFSKATAYDHIVFLQRKWRSLRDGYNRELRARRDPRRRRGRVYIHFERMSFLGGHESDVSDDNCVKQEALDKDSPPPKADSPDPLRSAGARYKRNRDKKRKNRERSSDSFEAAASPEAAAMETAVFEGVDQDSDKLFMLSFLPEMRRLPVAVKMWARAKIARVMQAAVSGQMDECFGAENVKTRRDSFDSD